MSPTLDHQLKAILTLLADRDERTADLVRQTLVDIGTDAVPSLEKAGEEANPYVRRQLQTLIKEIQRNDLEDRFRQYSSLENGAMDLEEGAFLVAQLRYPDLNVSVCCRELDRLAQEISGRLSRKSDPEDVIRRINHCLYSELGFHGNTQNYYDPDNSCLNRVLERRTGIPISLSVVYLLVAKRLGLPVMGVGLPGHFMLKYEQKDFCLFLDAFNNGQTLTRDECVRFLLNSGYEVHEGYFSAATSRDIVCRMLRNLAYVYNQLQDKDKVHQLTRLIHILQAPAQD